MYVAMPILRKKCSYLLILTKNTKKKLQNVKSPNKIEQFYKKR